MIPKVDESKCNGDALCVDVCPAEPNVFEMVNEKSHVVHPEECIECGACEAECPEEAIILE